MAGTNSQKAGTNNAEALSRYASGLFSPVIDKCEGCERIIEADNTKYCQTYISPAAKWRLSFCNFATHVKPELVTAQTKVNPLKASKRAMGKKK